MFSIGVRYCGGCNPHIDRARLVRGLQDAIKKIGVAVDFTTDRGKIVDIVLLINGCVHACLEEAYRKQGHNSQLISVKGEMVDNRYVQEDRILDFLVNKIAGLLDPTLY
jgi:hypothetical protein